MKNHTWQDVPGCPGIQIYPLFWRGTLSSNTFIIESQSSYVIIDPGMEPKQGEMVNQALQSRMEGQSKPILIILTHSHIDHSLQSFNNRGLRDLAPCYVVLHRTGAGFLEEKDVSYTTAEILNVELPDTRVDGVLFDQDHQPDGSVRNLVNDPAWPFPATVKKATTPGGMEYLRQTVLIAPGIGIDIIHTPGHTPDSICIEAGRLLFTGDLLLAVNYLIAGLKGWDPEALRHSLTLVKDLGEQGKWQLVVSGHGPSQSGTEAQAEMDKVLERTVELAGVKDMTPEHFNESARYALDLLVELNDMLAIIAGRLYMIQYRMQYLGESELAEQMELTLDSGKVDGLLEQFQSFAEYFEKGHLMDVYMVYLVARIMNKINRILDDSTLARAVDRSLLHRTQRLLLDFFLISSGLPIHEEFSQMDVNQFIASVIDRCQVAKQNEEILDALDDPEAYINALIARMAVQPVLREVDFTFAPGSGLPVMTVQRKHLRDALLAILEEIAGLNVKQIDIATVWLENGVGIEFSSPDGLPEYVISDRKLAAYRRKLAILGGSFDSTAGANGLVISIKLVNDFNSEYED